MDTNERGIRNAEVHAGLTDEPAVDLSDDPTRVGVPLTSGDLEAGQPTEPQSSGDDEPPRGGTGSDRDAWAAYAESQGVEVTENMSRDDIIAEVDASK